MSQPEAEKDERRAIGGYARRDALTPIQRQDIARRAAQARWDMPSATHAGMLKVGDAEIPCYVLDDGRRLIVQGGMFTALHMKQGTAGRGAGDRLAKFISTKSIGPYVPQHLAPLIIEPVKFKSPGGSTAYGYEATVLADLCDAVLAARKDDKLNYQQEHIAAQCEILVRAFARIGIIALVDEATGYQEVRMRDALQALLDRYLRAELAAWAKRFPDEFYKQIFRLRGWEWKGRSVNPPQAVAGYTNDIVYARLAAGIVKELEARNPKDAKGNRKAKHHQWLTEDVGHPALAQHLYAVIGLMRLSDTWADFKRMLNKAYPKRTEDLPLFSAPAPDGHPAGTR